MSVDNLLDHPAEAFELLEWLLAYEPEPNEQQIAKELQIPPHLRIWIAYWIHEGWMWRNPFLTLSGPAELALQLRQSQSATTELPKRAPADGGEDTPRLTVSLAKKQATLDSVPYDIPSENTLRWLQVLADHPGEWISGPELEQYDSLLMNARTDRWRKGLPETIQNLVDSEPAKGSRIRLSVIDVARP